MILTVISKKYYAAILSQKSSGNKAIAPNASFNVR
jgi:hypothetical protein